MYENMLKSYLSDLGASLVGFANLQGIDTSMYNNVKYGIAIAVALNPQIIAKINKGPTKDYYGEYNRVNKLLDYIAFSCEDLIKSKGFYSLAQISTYVTSDKNLTTPLPHKTVATRGGLGWIGKNALLVTPEYGSAVRISSILTDMPLSTAKPINESNCGKCTKCTTSCPGEAIKGNLWNVNSFRDDLINPFKCRQKARELLNQNIGIEKSLCGKCIEVCPFTQRYIKSMDL